MLPTHEIDSPAEYVDIVDPAWDFEKVQAERKAMREAKEDPDGHPVSQYLAGLTRYSLDAPHPVIGEQKRPRDYLAKPATVWRLKRLGRRDYREIQSLIRRDEAEKAAEEATRTGVHSVDGPGAVVLSGGGRDADLTSADLDAIWESDPTLIDRLGAAVMNYSRPLSGSEGKR